MSRLLKLAFEKYSMIEDGTGNYKGIKFKLLEKFPTYLKEAKSKSVISVMILDANQYIC